MYQTIEFSRLEALAPFASQFHIERIIVNAARNLDLQVRIDHRNAMLSFGTDLGVAQKEDCPEVKTRSSFLQYLFKDWKQEGVSVLIQTLFRHKARSRAEANGLGESLKSPSSAL